MPADLLTVASQHHRRGELPAAEALYRQVLDANPDQGGAWFLLGLLQQARGQTAPAVDCYRQAIRCRPGMAQAHNNLGTALESLGQAAEALRCYTLAVQWQPDYADAVHNLGVAYLTQNQPEAAVCYLRQAVRLRSDWAAAHNSLGLALAAVGQNAEALACHQQAARLQPDFAEAFNNQGVLLAEQGRLAEAAACYERALQVRPEYAEACNNLGVVRRQQDRASEALQLYAQALRCRPEYPAALTNLGETLEAQGRLDEARAQFEQALRLEPGSAAARTNLGNALRRQGDLTGAAACYEQVLAGQPHSAQAHNNLGLTRAAQGQPDAAFDHFQQAVQLQPHDAEALNNLGNAYKDQGRLDEAIACYRQAVALQPANAALHSNLLLGLHYHPGTDTAALFLEHQRWAEQHAAPLCGSWRRAARLSPATATGEPPVATSPAGPTSNRRLRIGYVSPDFRDHVMAFHIAPVLAAHDRQRFEIFCYADVPRPDAVTQRLQGAAEHWRSLVGLRNAEAAELIGRDGIDILVDLAGHTGGNRLLVFARPPAPIQVTHFGYPNTTSLATMAYRLTDAQLDPPGETERYHTETLIRLPEIAWCYQPSAAPEVNDLPARTAGQTTFGCLNNLAKVSTPTLALWARLLTMVPRSRLLLLSGAGSAGDQRLREALACHGVPPARLTLVVRQPRADYLGLYQRIDIGLDPFPYTGCTTTCDALWMGVPVVTLAGNSYVGRQSATVLAHLDLHELIASSPDAYLSIAARLAADLPRLGQLRRELRQRMQGATLTNALKYTRQLERVYDTLDRERRKGKATGTANRS